MHYMCKWTTWERTYRLLFHHWLPDLLITNLAHMWWKECHKMDLCKNAANGITLAPWYQSMLIEKQAHMDAIRTNTIVMKGARRTLINKVNYKIVGCKWDECNALCERVTFCLIFLFEIHHSRSTIYLLVKKVCLFMMHKERVKGSNCTYFSPKCTI